MVTYDAGGAELLDSVEPLWRQLIQHHSELSLHFGQEIASHTFEKRRANLVSKAGKLRVELAKAQGEPVGYSISTINDAGVGEIDSMFVVEASRNEGVGDALMRSALDWLDSNGVASKVLTVAIGNEQVYSFYERYGFFPRDVVLKQRVDDDS